MALFWMFCGGMALVTLTPRWVVQALADLLQGCGWNGEGNPFFAPGTVNLVPFRTLGDGYILAGNLIMFLPFGFFPALLWRGCTWKRALAAGLCVTGFIECWQLLVGRAFDIDDLWLNTLGAFCGFWSWCLLDRAAPAGPGGSGSGKYKTDEMRTAMAEIIRTENLQYAYPADEGAEPVLALKGVDLTIEQGSFVVVLGHNGSGKSTLAKTLNGVLLPCGGHVYVEGMDTLDEHLLLAIRRTVGMVFQNPDNQIVANVVEEDVAFAPENLGVPPEEIRRRVDDALKAVGMYEFREHAPHLLSGGQKQRVAIAGVLAMAPRCIVLDEPTAMLDPVGRREVMDTIKDLNRTAGVTVVLITHHMDEAAQADRLVVMSDGHVVADGAPREVFSHVEALKSVGLTVPETVELCWTLRKDGLDLPLDALSDEECAQALCRLLTEEGGAR